MIMLYMYFFQLDVTGIFGVLAGIKKEIYAVSYNNKNQFMLRIQQQIQSPVIFNYSYKFG